jgi:signal transduction histidine kinase
VSGNNDARAPLARLRGEFIEDADQQRRLFKDVDEMQAMINTALAFFRDDARLEQATQLDLAELLQPLIDDYRDQAIDITFHGPRARWRLDRLWRAGSPQDHRGS